MQQKLFPDSFGESPLDTPQQSQAAKEAGVAQVVEAREAIVEQFRGAIIAHIGIHGVACADDIATLMPDLVEKSPNSLGAAFTGLGKQGVIQLHGYKLSRRKARHAGLIGIWVEGPHWGH